MYGHELNIYCIYKYSLLFGISKRFLWCNMIAMLEKWGLGKPHFSITPTNIVLSICVKLF